MGFSVGPTWRRTIRGCIRLSSGILGSVRRASPCSLSALLAGLRMTAARPQAVGVPMISQHTPGPTSPSTPMTTNACTVRPPSDPSLFCHCSHGFPPIPSTVWPSPVGRSPGNHATGCWKSWTKLLNQPLANPGPVMFRLIGLAACPASQPSRSPRISALKAVWLQGQIARGSDCNAGLLPVNTQAATACVFGLVWWTHASALVGSEHRVSLSLYARHRKTWVREGPEHSTAPTAASQCSLPQKSPPGCNSGTLRGTSVVCRSTVYRPARGR